MGGDSQVSAAVRKIVQLVLGHPGGVDRAGLLSLARATYPALHESRLAALISQALSAELLIEAKGMLTAPPLAGGSAPQTSAEAPARGLRAVAVDVESLVHPTQSEPYLERHVYEVASVRFGTDRSWSGEAPRWQRYVQLPDGVDRIRDEERRDRVQREGVPAGQVWAELAYQCAGADMVVAYNGTSLDFPLLREEVERAGCTDPFDGLHKVDGLYLAHALWPAGRSHRLRDLAETVGANVAGLRWHGAADDAELLVRLMSQAAQVVAHWDSELLDLVSSTCPDSPAWRLLRYLAADVPGATRHLDGPLGTARVWDLNEVAQLLGRELADHPPRRNTGGTHRGRAVVSVPDSLRGADGRVDPGALAAVVHGRRVEPRPAQQRMAAALHDWTDRGTPGLLEAPTGTGKSYAVLASALDWLAAHPGRTAVIATFTKQLQSQMARDLKDLEQALPGILGVADLVKGQVNRLSLAALTAQLHEGTKNGTTSGRRARFTARMRFRELAVYLLLRLRACPQAPQAWTARSVDPVDVPAFFADYAGPVLPLWLETLSQRDGDYRYGAAVPLAEHTDTVREAVAGHRLILANHALVLSHLDELRVLGPDTLLVIDEAHELENAATSALTAAIDYRALEDLLEEHRAWLADARVASARARVASAVDELEALFDHEELPRLAARTFDARAKGVGVRVGSRAAVLASPYTGTAGSRDVRRLKSVLGRVAGALRSVAAAVVRYEAELGSSLDVLVRERIHRLVRRTDDAAAAIDRITGDLDALLDGPAAQTLDATEGEQRSAPLSRVVYAEELAEPEPGLRTYRFRIATSPLELPDDPEWQRYLKSFARVHYVSATLRVAGEWTFVRERLGLPETLPVLALPSPFDLAGQAELVCFSDFPSWAEQEEGAMRTVAHQLAGFAQEVTVKREGDAGHDGGAMVLTTARSTAAGISELLDRELRSRGASAPVVGALELGNARAVAEFTHAQHGGGFLVGTKGLWQGVDVADEKRLRLVWINKLPFAPFAAPIIEARRAAVRERAELAGHPDPDGAATERYYLPLAALQLRQAVGRLIRSDRHRGVVVISDRKLGGHTSLRRAYRRAFLGSLDDGLLRPDPTTGEPGGGNVVTMLDGWRRIWQFLAATGLVSAERARALGTDEALERHTLLPQTRRIRELSLTVSEAAQLHAEGRLTEEVLARSARIAGLLRLSDDPIALKPGQRTVITAVAEGRNVLGLLPTGFGKSYTFQLPALILPGTTIVISPLVALMHDQALELNRTIGGAVRALISPLRESSSRAGKTEVADQLLGRQDHGIRLVYVSPERMCQRRFRETVRQAVKDGRVTRIAVDEAHTMAQWEDFRPSMRRVGTFLAELREAHGLPVTAVTATANRSVHAALREGIFGLPADPPAPGSDRDREETSCPDSRGGLVTVRENPIRPELAIFRRSLKQHRAGNVTGLVEQVVDALDGHAILYCLTVKEVDALYAHLREYLGDSGPRVRRFHGRLTEAEKAAVMTEFREAPRQGEDGFAPLVTVATSAFGLGVNRSDIRTVFCVSPPTDLAALYQQIGRAGRDASGMGTDTSGPANTALALATSRGLRTAQFMTGQDLPRSLLCRMAGAVLAQQHSMDAHALAEALMGEDVAAGHLEEAELNNTYTADKYVAGIMRSFSALAQLGAVTDLGDYPPLCTVRPGEAGLRDAARDIEHSILETILALPSQGTSGLRLARLHVDALDAHLADRINTYRDFTDGPAGTWEVLADLHDRGLLDVSAALSRRLVTGLTVHNTRVPDGLLPLLTQRAERAATELAQLRDFFEDSATCAQRKFADYFGVSELPDGCCATARCRCSACWLTPDWPRNERRPPTADAFVNTVARAGESADSKLREQRLDSQIHQLVRLTPRGVHPRSLWHALRGEEASYSPSLKRRIPLPPVLRDSRYFGCRLEVPYAAVEKSLLRLSESGAVSPADDGMWHALRGAPRSTPAPRKGDTA